MFKSKLGALMLGVLMCASFGTTKAAQNDPLMPVAMGLGGVASGAGLAYVWQTMGKEKLPIYAKLPIMVGMAGVAYYIRTQLVPAPTQQAHALGLLGAVATFWYGIANSRP